MPWVLPGCWMKSNLAIMYKQTTQSALTEEVSKNNDPKGPKAKQIFLGIDAPPGAQSGGAKEGQQRYPRGAKLSLRRAAALCPKTIELSRRSLRGLRSWTVGLRALPAFAGARD